MTTLNTQWVPCKIENSGFSSERRFEVDLADNDGKVVGTAYIEYLQDSDHGPIQEGWPAMGETTDGFVQCRVLRREGDRLWVEFPGTEVFHVPAEALAST